MEDHFVYVFKVNDLCKIGRTRNPQRRISQLQTAIPFTLEVVYLVPTQHHDLERALHRRFEDKRRRGEWYALQPTDIEWIKGGCESLPAYPEL